MGKRLIIYGLANLEISHCRKRLLWQYNCRTYCQSMNEKVLVVEKRGHIGGNCYSTFDQETGIEYHKYGTHIFHTSNEIVWEYISRFTGFNSYRHQVLTTYNERMYQMPINLETINSFFNISLKSFEVEDFIKKGIGNDYIENPQNFEEKAISLLGKKNTTHLLKVIVKNNGGSHLNHYHLIY